MIDNSSLQSEKIETLITALVAVQAELKHAEKDGVNPHLKNEYATLESVIDATRGPLAKQGLVIIQQVNIMQDGKPCLVTTLAHKSGQFIRSFTPIINNKNDAQGLGSGITYARRYGLSAIMGISQTDDDATIAVGKPAPRSVSKKSKGKEVTAEVPDEF